MKSKIYGRGNLPGYRVIALALLSCVASNMFFPCESPASGVPVKSFRDMVYSRLPARNDTYAKKNIVGFISSVKEISARNFLQMNKFELSGRLFNAKDPKSDEIAIQFSFVSENLLNISLFLEELAAQKQNGSIGIISMGVNRQRLANKNAPEKTVELYNLNIKLKSSGRAGSDIANYERLLISDISRMLGFLNGRYEVSSIVLAELTPQLMVCGSFSLRGVKRDLLRFMDSGELRRISIYNISERGYETRPGQITMPFTLNMLLDKAVNRRN